METMPYRANLDGNGAPHAVPSCTPDLAGRSTWRDGLPVLHGLGLTLRELTAADAPSLHAHLTTDQVTRFISPPPASVTGFERFIAWTHKERAAGRYACFAVVPEGEQTAVGIFQVRRLDGRDGVAEWGFILGAAYWGTGLFLAGAHHVVTFAFAEMGLHRLEARASVLNGRGNAALAKVGAVREAVLRQSFERHGAWHDQALWSVCRDDWQARQAAAPPTRPRVH
jgi:[ribosomal protein S5]-alanine N-acetyltransferase